MTRFSVTWEGRCREDVVLSPSQIINLLETETSELRSFELNSIHSLAIMCDEPNLLKSTSSPETTSANTKAMRVVIEEEVKSIDSNSTLEDISSIDDLNSTTNIDFSIRDSPENACGDGDSGGTLEDDDGPPRPFEPEEPLEKDVPLESIDKKPTQLALSEREKNEELGVIIIPDHIVLTIDEKERLFEEFETESTEDVVKIQTVESEDDSKEEISTSEEKTTSTEETQEGHEEEDANSFENGVLVAEESSTEEEPVSISIDEQQIEKEVTSEKKENILIQYIKASNGAREFELELSPDCVEFQSGESDGSNSSSRRASFEDDCNGKLDVKTLDDAFELKPNCPEVEMEATTVSQDKNDGWSDSGDEKEGLTVKIKSCESGWGQSDDEIEQPIKAKSDRTASVISGDEKSKAMSDGSLCGDIRERGNVVDENRCSSSWNRDNKPFQKRNRNDFNDNRNYESRSNQSRDNQSYGQQSRDQGQRDNRHFDKAPGGTNRPRDQNRHGFDRYNRGAGNRNDDFGRNDDRRRSFNSDRSFHSYDRDNSNRSGGQSDRYGDDQNGQNRNERNHYHRNDHNRHDNRDRDNNFDRSSSYRRDNNRGNNDGYNRHNGGYNNGQDSGNNNNFGNNYGNNSRPYDNFNQRKSNFFEKENRDSPMSMKGDGQKRSPYNRDEHRRSFRDGGGHHDGNQRSRDQGDLFGSHDNRNNRRTVRLNPNPSAKITFVNDHCTRGEMDPSDKMRNDLNFNPKEDVENEGW